VVSDKYKLGMLDLTVVLALLVVLRVKSRKSADVVREE
jgi:hypothetical protein